MHRGHLQAPEGLVRSGTPSTTRRNGRPHTPGFSEGFPWDQADLSTATRPQQHTHGWPFPCPSRVLILSQCFLNHPPHKARVPKASSRGPLLEGPQARTPTEFDVCHFGPGWVRPAAQLPFTGLGRENNGGASAGGAGKTIAQSAVLTPPPPPRAFISVFFFKFDFKYLQHRTSSPPDITNELLLSAKSTR